MVIGSDEMKYSPKEMQSILSENEFYFKKKFGQNFIIDENIINAIIEKAELDQECMVIEIGPGAGSLTYKLSKAVKNVLCYEIDMGLKEVLENNLKDCSNVEIKFEDFLKAQVIDDLKNYQYKKLYVVANLPYYITTPIISKIIEDKIPVDRIVIMVQKEVGDRLRALPGSRDYGSLSIYINYYFEVHKILDVSRNVFIPKPNVDSIVVELTKKENREMLLDENIFFQLVRDSFKQKRKTLRNNLKAYPLDVVERVLKPYQLDLSVRAEQLSIEIFVEIANELAREKND